MVGYGAIKKGCINTPQFADNTILSNCINQRYNFIPIDFIKCKVIGLDIDHFRQNMNLTEYESKKENKSKYLFYKKDNITIKYFVESGLITLSGSLHKYFNKGKHNHNVFTHENYLTALERLKNEFAVSPENLKIICLEYGLNIKPPIKTKLILDNILMHRQSETETKINFIRGHYKQVKHDKYIIKVYDKAKQFNLQNDILRIEIKQSNWSEYRTKHKLISLADFNKADKTIFAENLLNKWMQLIFYDPTIKTNSKYHHYSNINFWRNGNPKQKSKHKKRLDILSQTHGENIRLKIRDQILKSIEEVQNSDFNTKVQILKSIEGVQNSELSKNKNCKLTGIDISNQKDESILLSHTGLKRLQKNDLDKFNQIRSRYLSSTWKASSLQLQVKEIAHNIRSRYSYVQRNKHPNQLQLF